MKIVNEAHDPCSVHITSVLNADQPGFPLTQANERLALFMILAASSNPFSLSLLFNTGLDSSKVASFFHRLNVDNKQLRNNLELFQKFLGGCDLLYGVHIRKGLLNACNNSHHQCKLSSRRVPNVVKATAKRLGRGKSIANYLLDRKATRGRLIEKFCRVLMCCLLCAPKSTSSSVNFCSKLEQHHQPLLHLHFFACLSLLTRNARCSGGRFVCGPSESDANATQGDRLLPQFQRHKTEEYRRSDRKNCDDHRPRLPPDHAPGDAGRHAWAHAVPQFAEPAHLIIPWWTRRQFATHTCPGESPVSLATVRPPRRRRTRLREDV